MNKDMISQQIISECLLRIRELEKKYPNENYAPKKIVSFKSFVTVIAKEIDYNFLRKNPKLRVYLFQMKIGSLYRLLRGIK